MLNLLKTLATNAVPAALWILAGLLAILYLFVGTALAVALFSSDSIRADRARKILRDLLSVLRSRRPR